MRRAIAVIAAILMIVLAIFVRSRLDADKADRVDIAGAPGHLVCATELRKVCEQLRSISPDLQIRIEDAGTTAATLSGGAFNPEAAKLEAWLVPQPYPTMVNEARQRTGGEIILDNVSGVLARSPLVLVVWKERFVVLEGACATRVVNWDCLGNVGGKPWADIGGQVGWGNVKPGHGAPDKTASGLLVLAQATGQHLGRMDYARNELEDPTYQAWLGQLEHAIPTFTPSTGTPLDEMLSLGSATFDAAGSIEALAGPSVTTSRDKDRLNILYPSPVATADIVLAPVRGSDPGGRIKELLESSEAAAILAQNGWRVSGQPAINGVRNDIALPDGNGLPRAGVLSALLEVWTEVIG